MSARDRIIAMVVGVVVVLGAAWIMVVSPERKKASGLGSEVATARSALASAEGQLAQAKSAETEYPAAYASIVSLGKAVPATQEVPSLIYELEHASNARRVEFASIASGAGPGGSAAGSSSPAAGSAATASTSSFNPMPFTFVFNGSFFDLEHLFETVDGFAKRTSTGLQVNGRLLTIQSMKMAPSTQNAGSGRLSGTITATAYVLPAGTPVAGSSASPASSTTTPGTSAGSPAPPPAVVTP
jgi:Tfp pilus assembly protein PilO